MAPRSTSASTGPTTRPGAAEPGLARRGERDRRRVVGRGEAVQVQRDARPPEPRERRPAERPPRGSRALAQVREAEARAHRADQRLHLRDVDVDRRREQRLEQRVGGVVGEEVGDDPVRHAQGPGQHRSVRVLHEEQARADERRERAEPRPRGRVRRASRAAAQLQREADARAAARHVVVEVAVEPLEPRVEVRGERDEEQLDVHGVERERPREVPQADRRAGGLRLGGVGLEDLQPGRGGEGRARRGPAAPARPRAARRPGRRRCRGRGTGPRGPGRWSAGGRRPPRTRASSSASRACR